MTKSPFVVVNFARERIGPLFLRPARDPRSPETFPRLPRLSLLWPPRPRRIVVLCCQFLHAALCGRRCRAGRRRNVDFAFSSQPDNSKAAAINKAARRQLTDGISLAPSLFDNRSLSFNSSIIPLRCARARQGVRHRLVVVPFASRSHFRPAQGIDVSHASSEQMERLAHITSNVTHGVPGEPDRRRRRAARECDATRGTSANSAWSARNLATRAWFSSGSKLHVE